MVEVCAILGYCLLWLEPRNNISSIYSPFSERVVPLHNIPSPGVFMKSIKAEYYINFI